MVRRTKKQIEEDYKRIREAAKKATSMKEIGEMTGLNNAQIKTCLSDHPIVERRIREQLKSNAVNSRKEKEKSQTNTKKENFTKYVIDASITGCIDIRTILAKICTIKDSKIILTSVTIKELNDIEEYPQKHRIPKDLESKDATYILNLAVNNESKFENVLIDENVGMPDDCIINYCAINKENLILLTADKEMCLKARMYGIQVQYFKKIDDTVRKANTGKKITKLWEAKKSGENLILNIFKTNHKSICVYSNNVKKDTGIVNLKIGDDVFVAVNKDSYITFAHYRMICLQPENNCEIIYYLRIYNEKELSKVANSFYKTFLKDFIAIINS